MFWFQSPPKWLILKSTAEGGWVIRKPFDDHVLKPLAGVFPTFEEARAAFVAGSAS